MLSSSVQGSIHSVSLFADPTPVTERMRRAAEFQG